MSNRVGPQMHQLQQAAKGGSVLGGTPDLSASWGMGWRGQSPGNVNGTVMQSASAGMQNLVTQNSFGLPSQAVPVHAGTLRRTGSANRRPGPLTMTGSSGLTFFPFDHEQEEQGTTIHRLLHAALATKPGSTSVQLDGHWYPFATGAQPFRPGHAYLLPAGVDVEVDDCLPFGSSQIDKRVLVYYPEEKMVRWEAVNLRQHQEGTALLVESKTYVLQLEKEVCIKYEMRLSEDVLQFMKVWVSPLLVSHVVRPVERQRLSPVPVEMMVSVSSAGALHPDGSWLPRVSASGLEMAAHGRLNTPPNGSGPPLEPSNAHVLSNLFLFHRLLRKRCLEDAKEADRRLHEKRMALAGQQPAASSSSGMSGGNASAMEIDIKPNVKPTPAQLQQMLLQQQSKQPNPHIGTAMKAGQIAPPLTSKMSPGVPQLNRTSSLPLASGNLQNNQRPSQGLPGPAQAPLQKAVSAPPSKGRGRGTTGTVSTAQARAQAKAQSIADQARAQQAAQEAKAQAAKQQQQQAFGNNMTPVQNGLTAGNAAVAQAHQILQAQQAAKAAGQGKAQQQLLQQAALLQAQQAAGALKGAPPNKGWGARNGKGVKVEPAQHQLHQGQASVHSPSLDSKANSPSQPLSHLAMQQQQPKKNAWSKASAGRGANLPPTSMPPPNSTAVQSQVPRPYVNGLPTTSSSPQQPYNAAMTQQWNNTGLGVLGDNPLSPPQPEYSGMQMIPTPGLMPTPGDSATGPGEQSSDGLQDVNIDELVSSLAADDDFFNDIGATPKATEGKQGEAQQEANGNTDFTDMLEGLDMSDMSMLFGDDEAPEQPQGDQTAWQVEGQDSGAFVDLGGQAWGVVSATTPQQAVEGVNSLPYQQQAASVANGATNPQQADEGQSAMDALLEMDPADLSLLGLDEGGLFDIGDVGHLDLGGGAGEGWHQGGAQGVPQGSDGLDVRF